MICSVVLFSNLLTYVLTFHMQSRVSYFIIALSPEQITVLFTVIIWHPVPLAAIHKDLHTLVGCTIGMVVCHLLNSCLSMVFSDN